MWAENGRARSSFPRRRNRPAQRQAFEPPTCRRGMDICVILGSKSDMPIAEKCRSVLDKFDVSYEIRVASAHRAPKYLEGIVDAAKIRFSAVGRYSPTASRTASSETYLICQKRLQRKKGEGTAMEHLQKHLASIGIVVDEQDERGLDTKVGFRKVPKRE